MCIEDRGRSQYPCMECFPFTMRVKFIGTGSYVHGAIVKNSKGLLQFRYHTIHGTPPAQAEHEANPEQIISCWLDGNRCSGLACVIP